MVNVFALKAADHVGDDVALADVGEELVAQAFAFAGALDQAGDVDEGHLRGERALRVDQLGQLSEPLVRDGDLPDVGLDGAERKVGALGARVPQRVEERRFADVGEPNDAA